VTTAMRALYAGIAIAGLAACGHGGAPEHAPPLVTVARPQTLAYHDYFEATGNTAASRSVNLVARVEGYLRKVYFRDGSYVAAGAPLFLIEPEQYEAKVKLNKAQLTSARAEYERQQRLIAENATSKASVENWLAQRETAEANTELAQINLDYAHLNAPFAGHIGRHLIDAGNLVGSGSATQLATLDQVRPIYVYFNVNERDLLQIRKRMAEQNMSKLPDVVPVEVGLQTDRNFPYQGTLDFVDVAVNAASGTLQARATLANDDSRLLPGLFVKLRIALGPPRATPGVPDTAVSHDQAGAYVLVVDGQSVVSQRRVETGGVVNGVRAITSGLSEADRVVVDGLLNAAPGNRVTVREAPAPDTHGG